MRVSMRSQTARVKMLELECSSQIQRVTLTNSDSRVYPCESQCVFDFDSSISQKHQTTRIRMLESNSRILTLRCILASRALIESKVKQHTNVDFTVCLCESKCILTLTLENSAPCHVKKPGLATSKQQASKVKMLQSNSRILTPRSVFGSQTALSTLTRKDTPESQKLWV